MARDLVRRAGRDHAAALGPGARPHVHDPVGTAHQGVIVLDDQQGVAPVPQELERSDQVLHVRGMQPDRGLVQDVEHPDQLGPQRGGEPNAPRLAPGQRRRGPIEREVAQPHLTEHPQAGEELGPDGLRDLGRGPRDAQLLHRGVSRIHVLRQQLRQPQPSHGHGARSGSQSLAVAGRTLPLGHDRLQRLAPARVLALLVPPIDLAAEATPLGPEVLLDLGRGPRLLDLDPVLLARTAPEQHEVPVSLAHLGQGPLRVDAVRGADRPEQVLVVALALDQEPAEGIREAALAQGLLRIGDEEVRVAGPARAKAMAVGTGPDDRVEREVPRLERPLQLEAALGAGSTRRVLEAIPALDEDAHPTPCDGGRLLDGLRQA